MGQRILALEFGADRVRAAMAERGYKTLELQGVYEEVRREDEPDLAGAIARVASDAGESDIVISALPGEFVAKRLLTLPFTDRHRLQQVVAFALEEHLPFAVDDAAVTFARVGYEGANSLVIAAFARKEDLRRHLELLARAGLDPKTVTLSTLALAGLLARAGNGSGSHLVIDVDDACTSMVLIDSQGMPRAMRTVSQTSPARNGRPAQAAGAILSAVRQTLLAHSTEHDIPALVLAGPAAPNMRMREQISDALAVPVHDLAEFDCLSQIQGLKPDPMRFASCTAMLLSEAPSKPLELLNFRLGEFAFRGSGGAIAPLRLSAMLAAGAALLALVHLVFALSTNVHQLHLLNREIAAVTAPALGSTDPAGAKAALQDKIKDMNKRLRQMGGSLGHGSPLDVLLAISQALPSGLAVKADSLTVDESGVKLAGTADSYAAVDQVKRMLERSGNFGAIQVDHAAAASDASKVDFRLSAPLKD
jgi:type IV pilus assembly PilN-like protein/type II secretion system (T2SS) protein L